MERVGCVILGSIGGRIVVAPPCVGGASVLSVVDASMMYVCGVG